MKQPATMEVGKKVEIKLTKKLGRGDMPKPTRVRYVVNDGVFELCQAVEQLLPELIELKTDDKHHAQGKLRQ